MTKLLSAVLALALVVGCQSKQKTEEKKTDTTPTQIDSSPMSFDPSGSDSGKINGLSTVHFEYDKSSITAESKKLLAGNADWLKNNPKANLQIEGHCDSRGSIEYNLSLGERRAQAVKNYLVGMGVSSGRMTIISYGKEKPLMQGDTEAAHGKNRRANFLPLAQ